MTAFPLNPILTDPSVARLQRGYGAFLALLEDYPEEKRDQPGACGDWSPRQVIAHICGWLAEATTRFKAIQAGDRANVQYGRESDFAEFNAESVAARAALTWDETMIELRSRIQAFLVQTQSVGSAPLAADPRYREWLDGLWRDCIEHMGQLSRFSLK